MYNTYVYIYIYIEREREILHVYTRQLFLAAPVRARTRQVLVTGYSSKGGAVGGGCSGLG